MDFGRRKAMVFDGHVNGGPGACRECGEKGSAARGHHHAGEDWGRDSSREGDESLGVKAHRDVSG